MSAFAKGKKVKSACRVLEILEVFDRNLREASVMEIARRLDYPQSSTSELLMSLVNEGYLIRDRWKRTYRPSARVALLGSWVQPNHFREGRLLPMMDALHDEVGHGVALATVIDVGLAHLHVVGDTVEPQLASGTEHHLLQSPFGIALLSTMHREHVRRIAHRINAESEPADRVRFEVLADKMERVARSGYAVGQVSATQSAVAVLLPRGMSDEQLSLGIIASSDVVDNSGAELASHLRRVISRFTAPSLVSDRNPQETQMSLAS